jgi:hypothetical protein
LAPSHPANAHSCQGLEFYNLIGFHVRAAGDSDSVICHIQMWTAGVNVSAGFHNHIESSFCEIHACIVNGTGQGGMSWATVPDEDFNPANPDPAQYKSIIVGDMHEHGPLWRSGKDGVPDFRTNGTVDYPWHGERKCVLGGEGLLIGAPDSVDCGRRRPSKPSV